MSNFLLKLIAVACMVVDHIGFVFFPDVIFYRVIGRLAFPIFAFLLVQGFFYTSNVKRYAYRLFLFALLSQAVYMLALDVYRLNIFFTLFFGLMLIYLDRSERLRWYHILVFIVFSIFVDYDYSWYGVMVIYVFYANFAYFRRYWILFTLLTCLYSLQTGWYWQMFALLSLPFIFFYNFRLGFRMNKYVFYAFYPLHLLILFFIKEIVDKYY